MYVLCICRRLVNDMYTYVLCVCRRLVNDSLRTDVSLLYPPYCIALAAIYMAVVYHNIDAKEWFAELAVDMSIVSETNHVTAVIRRVSRRHEYRK